MKRVNYLTGILMLALANTAQAVSFLDYYHGNAELGIPSHEAEINSAVNGHFLFLINKNLTDLNGFDEEHIPGLNRLHELYLGRNQLTELPQNIFHGFTVLGNLRLENNQLTTLPEHIFDGLVHLREINLANNQLTALPNNIFHDLARLEIVRLSNNQLTTLPQNIFHNSTVLQSINLSRNHLISLPENIFHGLDLLLILDLSSNQLTTLPRNVFRGLPLRELTLYDNAIGLNTAQLRAESGLNRNTKLEFKTPGEEQAERNLIVAIRNADAITVQQTINGVRDGWFRSAKPFANIDISKIRDANGDNLLHAAIRDAAERLRVIAGISAEMPAGERTGAQEVLAEQKSEINDRYMKVISAILSCGEDCVQEMLFTPNAEGQMVIDSMIAKLGPNSPITRAIFSVLTPDEEKKVRMEEASSVPRPKRNLGQPRVETANPPATMADVEEIEKEEQEKEAEDRKRQKPSNPKEQQ